MRTHDDPDNNIHIHHHGDYSGVARIVIPLGDSAPRDPEMIRLSLRDPNHDLNAEMGMPDDDYTIEFNQGVYGWYVVITVPAMVLVRFAASAVHDAMTQQLEQTSLEDLLKEHL